MASEERPDESADGDGPSVADLPVIRRELLMDALEVDRHEHDPATDWEAFCAVVWREAGLAFGFVERESWPDGLPRPAPPGPGEGMGGEGK